MGATRAMETSEKRINDLLDAARLVLRGVDRLKAEAPREWRRFRDEAGDRAEHAWENFREGISDLRYALGKEEVGTP